MTDSEVAGGASPHGSRAQRAGFLLALAGLGALLATSALRDGSEVGTGSRMDRRLELVELIAVQQETTDDLADQVAALEEEVQRLQADLAEDPAVAEDLQQQVDELSRAAGLVAVRGPGVVVTLSDSTLPLSEATNVNDLVIHEQDLQAVVNAVWTGGAEAVSVNDQRILTTSAVRCVGNILLLNGRVHPPPYVVAAIGDQVAIRAALDRDPSVTELRQAADTFDLGYDVEESDVEIPGFEGPPVVDVAIPAASA